MTYLEAKIRQIGMWRAIAMLINIIVFVLGIIGLYQSGFFTRAWYNQDKVTFFSLLIFYSAMNAFFVYKPAEKNIGNERHVGLLGLWMKRKRLENEAKIKELEK